MDLQNTVTHEAGHFLGLAHPCEADPGTATANGVPVCSGHPEMTSVTMFPSASPGEISKRTLAPDDVEGVCAIYPRPATAALAPAAELAVARSAVSSTNAFQCVPQPSRAKSSGGGCGAGTATPGGLAALARRSCCCSCAAAARAADQATITPGVAHHRAVVAGHLAGVRVAHQLGPSRPERPRRHQHHGGRDDPAHGDPVAVDHLVEPPRVEGQEPLQRAPVQLPRPRGRDVVAHVGRGDDQRALRLGRARHREAERLAVRVGEVREAERRHGDVRPGPLQEGQLDLERVLAEVRLRVRRDAPARRPARR